MTRAGFGLLTVILLANEASGQVPRANDAADIPRSAAPRPRMSPADMAVMRQPLQPIEKIAQDMYVIAGGGGNSIVRVTGKGVLLVDAKNGDKETFDLLVGQISTVTRQPVRFVINTHGHPDHAGNNGRFEAAGAVVLGQDRSAAHSIEPPPGGQAPGPPSRVFHEQKIVRFGDATIELRHVVAHSDGDALVYFPDRKILATGDVFTTVPSMAQYASGGSAYGLRDALERILRYDATVIVPGHGPIVSRSVIEQRFRDLDIFLARVEAGVRAATPKEALLSSIKADDISIEPMGFTWNSPSQLDGLYLEVSAKIGMKP